MRYSRIIGALAVAGLAAVGCQDITNPVEEFGEFAPAWVGFEAPRAVNGSHGSHVPVIYGALTTRPEEDVTIEMSFGGQGVYGTEFTAVDGAGSTTPHPDFSAAGGTVTLPADPTRDEPLDTLWLYVFEEATVGNVLEVNIDTASTVGGDPITVGYQGDFDTFQVTFVPAPAQVPTGTYAGTLTGDLGEGDISIEVADAPATVSGTEYRYRMSDFAALAFGDPIPWSFNVFSDGSVEFAPNATGIPSVTADITGSYDLDTNTLSFDVTLTCCGAAGLQWSHVVTAQ